MVSFQASRGDDPEELVRRQGFDLSVNPEGQVAVFFPDAEGKDLLKMQEALDDVFPLCIINGFDLAPLVLGLFRAFGLDRKRGLHPQRPWQDFSAAVRESVSDGESLRGLGRDRAS